MPERFLKCCPACRRTFSDPYLYREHVARLHPRQKTPEEILSEMAAKSAGKPAAQEHTPVIVANDTTEREEREEAMLERTSALQGMKNKLYAVGIECQTLNEEQTRKIYNKALQDGVIQ